jgi:hypothetical protein
MPHYFTSIVNCERSGAAAGFDRELRDHVDRQIEPLFEITKGWPGCWNCADYSEVADHVTSLLS